MKKVLIASFDMGIGGVERSLISMLNNFDYKENQVDLMLYSHTGELINHLPQQVNLLAEVNAYRTFRMSIKQVFKVRQFQIGVARLLAKIQASISNSSEKGHKQMQYMWKHALPALPRMEKTYDIAISYLWPHYFVAEKVKASTKIAWIHTDFSKIDTNINEDVKMWGEFDYIVAVSEDCKHTFINKYPVLEEKVIVIENIKSPDYVRMLAKEKVNHPFIYDNRFKVVTVARLSHAKGIDRAVKALYLLKSRGYNNIAWYVVGYGGDEAQVLELIDKYNLKDSFILLGKHTNPYPFMKAADLYVQPSRYEGKAVTVEEAQILGKPVLITNYTTAKSQVNHEVDGMICNLSIEGIADGIENLYNNFKLREQLKHNCQTSNYQNNEELEKLYALV